jgi:electron transport complex protein RnfC
MLERPDEVVYGANILRHALGLSSGILAVEDNKPDAIEALRKTIAETGMPFEVAVMKTKYPQGDERQIMYALLGKELPAGKLPADIGCVIFNAETSAAVAVAFYDGTPLVKRIVTVDGDCLRTPKNLLVHIGTSYMDLIHACGGLVKAPKKIVNGGPMMGFAQWDIGGAVTKGTSAILVFSAEFDENQSHPEEACIRCGRCVKNCPMHLMPNYLALYTSNKMYEEAEKMNALSCVECGTCSYNCPGNIHIVQHIRVAKGVIRAEKQRAKEAAEASKAK